MKLNWKWTLLAIATNMLVFLMTGIYLYIYIYIYIYTHTHTCKYFLHFLYMYVCFFINTYKYTHYINPFLFWMWLIDLTALLDIKITQINHIYSIYTYLNKIYVDINCIKKTIIPCLFFFFFFFFFYNLLNITKSIIVYQCSCGSVVRALH